MVALVEDVIVNTEKQLDVIKQVKEINNLVYQIYELSSEDILEVESFVKEQK